MTLTAAQVKVALLDYFKKEEEWLHNLETLDDACMFELGIRSAVIALVGYSEAVKVVPDVFDIIDKILDQHPEIDRA